MPNLERIDSLYRGATNCRECFEGNPRVEAPIIDVAQPRWIGSEYFRARPRIVFVPLNPGAGSRGTEEGNRVARELLLRYRDGKAALDEVLTFQRDHMKSWGKPPASSSRPEVRGYPA